MLILDSNRAFDVTLYWPLIGGRAFRLGWDARPKAALLRAVRAARLPYKVVIGTDLARARARRWLTW